MTNKAEAKAVSAHRARQRRKGLVRIEVQVPKVDTKRIREVAKQLRKASSDEVEALRRKLNALVAKDGPDLKALLMGGPPLDFSRELERASDFPRSVDFDGA